ncbi:hypothetical protein RB195_018376 [Necator americanus]|uniref:Endonuclease/exonuclease/phosphatase domain-containing protein n=1 Tax=Necator americanus TaxID=51031 RepID=A0ABR1CCD9_NECAM
MDSGHGLPVSAEPGLTHDILVSRTSVRQKACNQVTGRCKGGGLESSPRNKLYMSTPEKRKFSQKQEGPTPALTIFVAYAPTSSYEEEEVEAFYMDLEKFYREDHAFYKVIISDLNAKVGPRRTPEELYIGTHGLQWNEQGDRLSEFIMTTKTIHGNSQFQKPSSLRWTWESPGGGHRNEIDQIIVNKRFCLTDVAVVPKFYTGSDHRLLRKIFFHTERRKTAKLTKQTPRTITNWDLLRYVSTLAGFWEDSAMDNIDEEYDPQARHSVLTD